MERFLESQHHKVRSAVCPSVPSVGLLLGFSRSRMRSLHVQVEDSHHQMASASAAVETVRLKNLETGQEMRLNLLELKQSVHLEKQVHRGPARPTATAKATAKPCSQSHSPSHSSKAKPQPQPQRQPRACSHQLSRDCPHATPTPPQVHSAKGRELVENAKHVQSAKVLERQLSHPGKRQAQGAKTKAEREVHARVQCSQAAAAQAQPQPKPQQPQPRSHSPAKPAAAASSHSRSPKRRLALTTPAPPHPLPLNHARRPSVARREANQTAEEERKRRSPIGSRQRHRVRWCTARGIC